MSRNDGDMLSLRAFLSLRYAAGGSPLTQLVSQRIGAVCAWTAYRLGLSPNAVTCFGSAIFFFGSILYAALPGGGAATLCCLLIFHLAYGLDCADGQLARATGRTGRFGAWLDLACDYLRQIFLALALVRHLIVQGLGVETSLFVSGALLSGTVVQLHTVSALRQGPRGAGIGERGKLAALRQLGELALDTCTHLTAFSLLRDFPALLIPYAIAIGVAYGALAVMQARDRVR